MKKNTFLPGISTLLRNHGQWIENRRIGLVSHAAAVDVEGVSSAELLRTAGCRGLVALFAPEHGYFGATAAGRRVGSIRHRRWGIPIYSLYGSTKKPLARMLNGLDVVVFDLQGLAARQYTYVSTLRHVMEKCDEMGKRVIVADRPVPLPSTIDGPVLDPCFESFVGCVSVPIQYGMTPGEIALWIKGNMGLSLDLKVAAMRCYCRDSFRGCDWPSWIPPSPEIRSWESGCCYTATVFFEALPAVDCGRGTALAFQVFGAPWMKAEEVCEHLSGLRLAGVKFHCHEYAAGSGRLQGKILDGVRMTVTDAVCFRPVTVAVAILSCLQSLYGRRRVWQAAVDGCGFFDSLFGTDMVRQALFDGEDHRAITGRWKRELSMFRRSRQDCLLYEKD
jgi:uncharacterized protein YbbC (DUF1343 family)